MNRSRFQKSTTDPFATVYVNMHRSPRVVRELNVGLPVQNHRGAWDCLPTYIRCYITVNVINISKSGCCGESCQNWRNHPDGTLLHSTLNSTSFVHNPNFSTTPKNASRRRLCGPRLFVLQPFESCLFATKLQRARNNHTNSSIFCPQ